MWQAILRDLLLVAPEPFIAEDSINMSATELRLHCIRLAQVLSFLATDNLLAPHLSHQINLGRTSYDYITFLPGGKHLLALRNGELASYAISSAGLSDPTVLVERWQGNYMKEIQVIKIVRASSCTAYLMYDQWRYELVGFTPNMMAPTNKHI